MKKIIGAVLCALAFVSLTAAQTTIDAKNGGTTVGVFKRYFPLNCSTGMSCSLVNGVFTMTSTSAPAPASMDALTSPTGNYQVDMKQFSWGLNWTVNSSTTNLFSVSDFATNTGTGYLFTVSSGASSAVKPFRVCYRGTTNCITYDSGTLAAIGTSLINANQLLGATWASPSAIGTGTPAAITGTTITATTQFSGSGAGLTSIPQSGIAAGNYTIGAYYIDQAEIAAPANPSAGVCREYVDSTTHVKTWKNSAGTSCGPSAGGGITNSAPLNHLGQSDNSGNLIDSGVVGDGTGNVTLPAGKSIGSSDTGTPKFTFGTNAVSVNQPLTVNSSGSSSVSIGTDNSAAGTVVTANGSAAAHTTWGSGATTSNTINGFATVPTTGHLVDCTVSGTTCLLHDSGLATANVVQTAAFHSLTDGATITWAIGSLNSDNATVTLGGNRTLNITGPVNGGYYTLKIVQDATGSRGLALGTGCTWKVINGGSGAITPSTTANAIDILTFTYDGTNCYASLGKNYN